MKYLITGGCGFLGSNLAVEAMKRGHELTIFDNLYRFGSERNLKWLRSSGDFNFNHGDIRNHGDVENIIKGLKPDVIFHLAGQVAMTTSIENPLMDFEINARGTFNLLESVRKYCPESAILYSSTNKVYGDLEWVKYEEREKRYVAPEYPNGFPEDVQLEFHSPYGCSKGTGDQYMLDYSRIFGLKTAVFRHSSMFGGRQFSTYDQGWIGWFCHKAVEIKNNKLKEDFTISGNGKQVRDVLYADDMINLYFTAAENIEKIKGQPFNIGGGIDNSLSLLELFEFLESELKIKMTYTKLPPRESDQKIFVADIEKINNLIKWKPKINKHEGVKKMLDWVEKIQ